jgi:hypothetical protein
MIYSQEISKKIPINDAQKIAEIILQALIDTKTQLNKHNAPLPTQPNSIVFEPIEPNR